MAYSSSTTYITRDKYLDFAGIDLDIELKSLQSDNPTKHTELTLKNIQTWFYNYLANHFEMDSDNWNDDTFAEALLWQVKHILKYGEDGKIDDMAWDILHNAEMVNPAVQSRNMYWW